MNTNLTATGMISAMSAKPRLLPKTEPTLLRDVAFMKRNRRDKDTDQFEAFVKYEFANGLNATISGAAWAMHQWGAKADDFGWPATKRRMNETFLQELKTILAGDRRGWVPPHERENEDE